jgi:hypothetical protein
MSSRTRLLLSGCVLASVIWATPRAHSAEPTTAECLSASEASLTLRRQHKLRDARAQLLTCSAASCPADVRNECLRRLGDINAAMPTIVFAVKDAAGNDLATVKVTMDGRTLAEQLDGTALAVDPGEHVFSFSASGHPTLEKKLVIREGEKIRREQISLRAPALASSERTTAPPVVSSGERASPPEDSGGIGTQRIIGIVAAGVGVVGVGVGTGYGLYSLSKHNQANKVCPGATCPTADGANLWRQAVDAGNVATVGFVVGAVGLAAGAALWFTAPTAGDPSEGPTVQVGIGPGTLQLSGAW